ncbi:hypothetical protein V7103_10180 [Neobacillus drentensis]|jgi:alpha-galactosidase|uniref:hypothetical protein n=1 Tax=Neobacillus drentensis TaxID=220684 RepID=UPI000BF8A0C1|nr:hypothetical protein CN481_02420 [Bacillus sp. AFS006103]
MKHHTFATTPPLGWNSHSNRLVYRKDDKIVWMAKDQGNHTYAALFNATDETAEVEVTLKQLGFSFKEKAKDLWNQEDLGEITAGIKKLIPPHGSILIKLI